jgi:signal transduction histidine kinase
VVALAVPGWASAATRLGVLEAGAAAGLAWLVGSVVRGRRARAATVVERAAHLEREREALTRQAVADERLRIARELHDVVAHDLSVVVVHAQAVQSVLDRDPAQARALVAGIEETGREALVEMRHLLGVLRDTHPDDRTAAAAADGAPAAGAPVPGPPVPQPGLDRLPALIDQVNAAGVPVTLRVSGPPERVPAAVQLSAYRIVQEALTNVLKHAGVATATVDVDQEGDVLHLTVTDAGRGAAAGLGVVPAGPGHGLVGMKERVGMFGGRLSAGPRPGGGFQVQAWIPLAEAAS